MLIYFPWFFFLEKQVTEYHVIHTNWDDMIPFNEYFIIPYLLWFLYVAVVVVYLLIFNKAEYYKSCVFLFGGMSICLLICTIWPNGQDLRPILPENGNFCIGLIRNLYLTDTPTNIFPSIHVYNSIGAHIAIMSCEQLKKKPLIRIGSFVLMVSICLATVFLKQHSVVDGLGAVLLSVGMYWIVYYPERAWTKQELEEQIQGYY